MRFSRQKSEPVRESEATCALQRFSCGCPSPVSRLRSYVSQSSLCRAVLVLLLCTMSNGHRMFKHWLERMLTLASNTRGSDVEITHMRKQLFGLTVALTIAGCAADSQNSEVGSSAANIAPNGLPAAFSLSVTDAPIVASIAAPTIDKVYGRDGVAAIYFTPAQQNTRLTGISFHIRNNCNGQTVPVSASPARINGLPLDTPCAFTAQLVASQGASAFSNVSRTITMSSRKYFGYYNYYHGFQGEAYTNAFNLDVQKTHGNLVYINYNDYGPSSQPRVFDRIREATEQGMFVAIDIQYLFYGRTPNPLAPGEFTDRRVLRDDHEKQWENFSALIEPYRDNIVAFYDEETYWGAAYHLENPNEATISEAFEAVNVTLKKVSDAIRASHPEIAFAVVDEGQAFAGRFFMKNGPGPATLQTCSTCRDAIEIPQTVDWIGFEGEYPVTDGQYQNWAGHSIPEYLAFTKARFTSDHQKLVLAPPTFLPIAETSAQIADMQMIVNRFWSLAQNEPRLAAVVPYFWSEEPRGAGGTYERYGLYGQRTSVLRSQFKKFGQCVVNKFAGDCTPTSTPPPPVTPSIPAGIFTQLPSIYNSNGNYEYCGFTSEAHFLSYSPTTPASAYPAYATIPANMIYKGACAQKSACVYPGGQEPGHSCVFPGASVNHGVTASINAISGGTGQLTATCNDGRLVDVSISCAAAPVSLPAGIFRVPPSSIYQSNGNFGYCGFLDEAHFNSYSPGVPATQYASYASIPGSMVYQGGCARLGCFYAGGQEPGHSCIWPSASAGHGSIATIAPVSGGTGSFQASCSNGQWQVLSFVCTPTPATPPSFPAGPFGYGGNLYYSNGSYHFCKYNNLQHYLSHGNPENFSSLAQLYPFNGFMINDGACGG